MYISSTDLVLLFCNSMHLRKYVSIKFLVTLIFSLRTEIKGM
jgi:hypothetical protein